MRELSRNDCRILMHFANLLREDCMDLYLAGASDINGRSYSEKKLMHTYETIKRIIEGVEE